MTTRPNLLGTEDLLTREEIERTARVLGDERWQIWMVRGSRLANAPANRLWRALLPELLHPLDARRRDSERAHETTHAVADDGSIEVRLLSTRALTDVPRRQHRPVRAFAANSQHKVQNVAQIRQFRGNRLWPLAPSRPQNGGSWPKFAQDGAPVTTKI